MILRRRIFATLTKQLMCNSASGCSGLRKRRRVDAQAPSTITRRLRAREDGEKPSPPRDCKAKKFSARATDPCSESLEFDGGMGRPRRVPKSSGNSPSQETGGVSIRIVRALRMRFGTTFNSRARGRGGKMRLRFPLLLSFFSCHLQSFPSVNCARTNNRHDSRKRYRSSGAAIASAATLPHRPLGSAAAHGSDAHSGTDGSFSLTLAPGRYRVSVEHASFRARRAGIHACRGRNANVGCAPALEKCLSSVVVTDTAEPASRGNGARPRGRDHRAQISNSGSRFGSRRCWPPSQASAFRGWGRWAASRRFFSMAEIRTTPRCWWTARR